VKTGRKALGQMSGNKALIDVIGCQLRLQWEEDLSEPSTNVLQALLRRLREAEAKQQPDQMAAPLTAIGDAAFSAVLCPSDVSEKSRDLVADLRLAIEVKMKQNTH